MNYYKGKEQARQIAQEWQQDQSPKTWAQIVEFGETLHKIGKRYGLLKEFKNEGII